MTLSYEALRVPSIENQLKLRKASVKRLQYMASVTMNSTFYDNIFVD